MFHELERMNSVNCINNKFTTNSQLLLLGSAALFNDCWLLLEHCARMLAASTFSRFVRVKYLAAKKRRPEKACPENYEAIGESGKKSKQTRKVSNLTSFKFAAPLADSWTSGPREESQRPSLFWPVEVPNADAQPAGLEESGMQLAKWIHTLSFTRLRNFQKLEI